MSNLSGSYSVAHFPSVSPTATYVGPGSAEAIASASDDESESSVGLSPDALMAYCQSRLDSIDGQVQSSFGDQQQNASALSQIDAFAEQLKSIDGSDQKGAEPCKKLEASFSALINSLKTSDPSCPALPALTTAYNTMVYSGDGGAQFNKSTNTDDPDYIDIDAYPPDTNSPEGDKILGATELQGFAQTVTDSAGSLNSNSELQMVQLQSLMSQRQTAISLTTNLVQSLGDQANKIADNIGK
jgi:hypothetical protein